MLTINTAGVVNKNIEFVPIPNQFPNIIGSYKYTGAQVTSITSLPDSQGSITVNIVASSNEPVSVFLINLSDQENPAFFKLATINHHVNYAGNVTFSISNYDWTLNDPSAWLVAHPFIDNTLILAMGPTSFSGIADIAMLFPIISSDTLNFDTQMQFTPDQQGLQFVGEFSYFN